jgi:quercetin 2,3-dioxygenase
MRKVTSSGKALEPVPRSVTRTITPPPPAPGFIGEGHTAVEVVRSDALAATDPFVLLMDDRLDIPVRRQIGGAHPHAGLETVTLVLEGTLWDRDEGELGPGDAIWMTAGRGIIHNEAVETVGRSRILQLWLTLPKRDRAIAPQFEVIRKDAAPLVRAPGLEARLYSGTTGIFRSPTRNLVPVTLVEITLAAGARFAQALPVAYNGFVYVIEGSVHVGDAALARGHVGWLDRPDGDGSSELELVGGELGARLVLYAGLPQHEPIVQHGPFVAGSPAEINDLYRQFRAGHFESMSAIARRLRNERQES